MAINYLNGDLGLYSFELYLRFMKIIKIGVLGILCVFLSCRESPEPQKGFEVRGDVKGLGSSRLLVLKFIDGGLALDSITAQNDTFTYYGEVKEPYFVQILVQQDDSTSGKLTEFMLENATISITGNSIAYDSVNVSGSISDKVLKAYFREDENLIARWDSLKLAYDGAVALQDSIQRKIIGRQLNRINQVDRVNLLKKYVSQNSNSTVGALLPSFCTLEDVLTPEDYKQLYNILSKRAKQTNYGQALLEKTKEATE